MNEKQKNYYKNKPIKLLFFLFAVYYNLFYDFYELYRKFIDKNIKLSIEKLFNIEIIEKTIIIMIILSIYSFINKKYFKNLCFINIKTNSKKKQLIKSLKLFVLIIFLSFSLFIFLTSFENILKKLLLNTEDFKSILLFFNPFIKYKEIDIIYILTFFIFYYPYLTQVVFIGIILKHFLFSYNKSKKLFFLLILIWIYYHSVIFLTIDIDVSYINSFIDTYNYSFYLDIFIIYFFSILIYIKTNKIFYPFILNSSYYLFMFIYTKYLRNTLLNSNNFYLLNLLMLLSGISIFLLSLILFKRIFKEKNIFGFFKIKDEEIEEINKITKEKGIIVE